ncbi:methylated-DNA--[protein]-cysteine S-methyltransferase [Acanthopleuribacter pedis]|uniref:Methylated-DNA--[protein]-cysteine S-methyltransferase n=1 Tax=Acanthopleuribacter pedis TaxID=442870 RepID=A0A8J7U098_9BACT|nr:methylated-DNA--[protein]-cysteine S-methyltransferase [Acanthopleuribacter pedis]
MAENSWNERVWQMVAKIPHGRVASYGQIARMLGAPRKARHVGYALAATPKDRTIPWQRVINSRGMISFPVDSHQYRLQKAMLLEEGVVFSDKDRINLRTFGWTGEHP